jgi:hypothetical protein
MDIFLIHNNFLENNLDINSKILPSAASDHKPISLALEEAKNYGPLPFCFNPLWLHKEEAMDLIKRVWSGKVEGSPAFMLESKLREVKKALKIGQKPIMKSPKIGS